MPSRPVLIGRGLVTHTPHKPTTCTKNASTIQNLNQQTHTRGLHVHNRTTVHNVTAAIAAGKNPDPSRTRKLSQPAPMVLHPTGCGRVGRRRTILRKRGHPGGPFSAFPGACSLARPPEVSPPSVPRRRSDRAPPQAWVPAYVIVGPGLEGCLTGGDAHGRAEGQGRRRERGDGGRAGVSASGGAGAPEWVEAVEVPGDRGAAAVAGVEGDRGRARLRRLGEAPGAVGGRLADR